MKSTRQGHYSYAGGRRSGVRIFLINHPDYPDEKICKNLSTADSLKCMEELDHRQDTDDMQNILHKYFDFEQVEVLSK